VEGPSPLIGRPQASRFTIAAQAEGGSAGAPVEGAGQFVRLARIPGWILPVVAVLFLGGIGLLVAMGLNSPIGIPIANSVPDLRTIVAQTAEVAAIARNATETSVAQVLNQTSTAIAGLPEQPTATETAQAIAIQQTQTASSQQRSTFDAQAQQTSLVITQQTQQVAEEQTQVAAQQTAAAADQPSPTLAPTLTSVPATVVAGAPTATPRATAALLPSSTPNVALPTPTSTSTATNTPIATLTDAPVPPTLTPTNTALPPTLTSTNTPMPTIESPVGSQEWHQQLGPLNEGTITSVLIAGKFRTQSDLVGMSIDDQRNILIVELAGRTNQPGGYFQSLDNDTLAGVGALLVYFRAAKIRNDQDIKNMSDDGIRNIFIVELDARTHRGITLQGLSNIELVRLALSIQW